MKAENNVPKADEIAELHALSNHVEIQVRESLYLVKLMLLLIYVSTLFPMLTDFFGNFLSWTHDQLADKEDRHNRILVGAFLFTLNPLYFYLNYKFLRFLYKNIDEHCPQGLFDPNKPLENLALLHRPISKEELKLSTQKLHALSKHLNFQKKLLNVSLIILPTIVPIILREILFYSRPTEAPELFINCFPLIASTKDYDLTGFDPWVRAIAKLYQYMLVSKWVWSATFKDIFSDKKVASFIKNISHIACVQTVAPVLATETNKSLRQRIFTIDVTGQSITIPKTEKKTISTAAFVRELHRALLKTGIPVYMTGLDQIFIGYTTLSKKEVTETTDYLLRNLNSAWLLEKNILSQIEQLDQLNKVLNFDTWDYYYKFNQDGESQACIYCNINSSNTWLSDFTTVLKENLQVEVEIDGTIATIKKLPEVLIDNNAITIASKALRGKIQAESSKMPHTSPNFDNQTVLQKKASSPHQYTETASTNFTAIDPYPEEVIFANGMVFNKNDQNRTLESVFPLHVPWLAEGKAYAAIIPEAVESLITRRVSAAQILNRLNSGQVHGLRQQQDKSKSGAVGIQTTKSEAFTDINGNKHNASSIKLKFNNNLRCLAPPPDTHEHNGKKLLFYRFCGPGFGH